MLAKERKAIQEQLDSTLSSTIFIRMWEEQRLPKLAENIGITLEELTAFRQNEAISPVVKDRLRTFSKRLSVIEGSRFFGLLSNSNPLGCGCYHIYMPY